MPMEFWSGSHNTSSPKEFQGQGPPGQPRPDGRSPPNPNKEGPGKLLSARFSLQS